MENILIFLANKGGISPPLWCWVGGSGPPLTETLSSNLHTKMAAPALLTNWRKYTPVANFYPIFTNLFLNTLWWTILVELNKKSANLHFQRSFLLIDVKKNSEHALMDYPAWVRKTPNLQVQRWFFTVNTTSFCVYFNVNEISGDSYINEIIVVYVK